MLRRIASIALALAAVAAVTSQSSADAQKLPFDVELVKPLGFRTKPGLDNAIPFVFDKNHYLQPPRQVHITGVATGTLWVAGAFCSAEVDGKSGFIRCDDAGTMKPIAAGTPAWPTKNASGVHCGSFESCKKFCAQACDVTNGSVSCPRITGGEGMLDLSQVKPLPALQHITYANDDCDKGQCAKSKNLCKTNADCGQRGTQEVIDGLKKLDAVLDSQYAGYSVMITSCWRDGITESKGECWVVMHDKNPAAGTWALPGANPHSGGHGCDMYLRGKQRTEHGDRRDGVCANQESSKAASAKMDEIMTAAGALRLDYEPWHYEWGGSTSCRCKAPDCNTKFWPPACSPSQCP